MDATTYFRIKKMSSQLLVSDIERSITFYTKELGFAVEFRYEDFYAGIIKDGCSIHLKAVWQPAEKRKNNQNLDILFSVGEIESVYEEIGKKSVEITQPLRSMPYGKEFYVADPDGNIIAFVQPLE